MFVTRVTPMTTVQWRTSSFNREISYDGGWSRSSSTYAGTITWGTEEVPLAILDRAEIIRGPGASIWGTNAVSDINVTSKPAESTQGIPSVSY